MLSPIYRQSTDIHPQTTPTIEDFLMKHTNTRPRSLMAALLGLGLTAAAQAGHANTVTPPSVPDQLNVLPGNKAFLVGHATGTQNYVCLPKGAGFAYVLFTPEATLVDDHGKQIITHYFSPNLAPDPGEIAGTIRATWQTSDTSIVWAKGSATATATHETDPGFVAEGAVAWLTLARVGAQDGPRGEDTLSDVTFVQRLNTHGGLAPGDCTSANVGKVAFMPYTADYFFYAPDDDAN
jgi:hypothetical protein